MRRRGTSVWDERFERGARRTFGEAAIKYLKEYDGRDKDRRVYALQALNPYVGKTRLIDINDDALSGYKDDRRDGKGAFSRPAMAGTINFELSVVRTIMGRACEDWQWMPYVPKVRSVKGAEKTGYPLTWDEQDLLFSKLPPGWADGEALFAVNTGVREQELFSLRWSDLVPIPSLETFVFILKGEVAKNGQDRAIICNSLARLAVNNQRDNGSKYVFPSRSLRVRGERRTASQSIFMQAWNAAGLPVDRLIKRGIHNLRYTFSHRLSAEGVGPEDRNRLLGHANSSLAEHYAMPDLKRLLEAAELATRRTDGVILRRVMSVA